MTTAAQIPAVLGEGVQPKVFFSVVQAVMVNVVNNQMVRGVGNLAVHFDALAVFFSNGVAILMRTFCKPGVSAQARVVFGIDDGELSAGQRYQAWRLVLGIGGS